MTLTETITRRLCEVAGYDYEQGAPIFKRDADAIFAAIREHMTSPEAVERAANAWINDEGMDDMRAAILAALGEEL